VALPVVSSLPASVLGCASARDAEAALLVRPVTTALQLACSRCIHSYLEYPWKIDPWVTLSVVPGPGLLYLPEPPALPVRCVA
jgi:hypothetical protein